MVKGRYLCGCAAAVVFAVLAGTGDSQTAPPSAPKPTTAGAAASRSDTATARATQPAEFLVLADKARQFKSGSFKGSVTFPPPRAGDKAEPVEFEIRARPPMVRLQMLKPFSEFRLTDGKDVYTFRPKAAPSESEGRRRQINPGNFYHALELAALVCDAADGYANLSFGARFVPLAPEQGAFQKLGELAWFKLEPTTKPPHHLLKDAKEVKIALGAQDGLVRVVIGVMERKEGPATMTVTFSTVAPAQINAEDLALPAEAVAAKWTDADSGGPIPAPRPIIAPPKP